MVIDSQALAFLVGVLVCVACIGAWFLPFDYVSIHDKAFGFFMVWMVIGWFPMGCIGLGIGLILGHLTGTLNEFTTGATLIGMVSWIPVGVTTYHFYEKTL